MTASWDDPALRPASESARVARHRRLQFWYREIQLGVAPGTYGSYDALGSMLDKRAVAEQRDLNFLHPAAYEHAEDRAIEVQKESGALDPTRLFHNMLSSMPLCFNLFGTMRGERDAFLPLVNELFDAGATELVDVVCEWAPHDGIGDRTAFDAIVFYRAGDEDRFVAIEVKYTESFSAKEYDPDRYRQVTNDSPWFVETPDFDLLKASKSNQLWRNTMLAATLDADGSHGRGMVAVVALADDSGARAAINAISSQLAPSHADRLVSVPIETIIETTRRLAPDLKWWATSFERRYLSAGLPDRADAARDPLGPRLGRTLTATVHAARDRSGAPEAV